MKKKESAKLIKDILDKCIPNPEIPLKHFDHYTLLIAVLLSAQCTDEKVNLITPLLFKKGGTPKKMVELGIDKIEEIIRTLGLAPSKAKNIWQLSNILLEKFDSSVPDNFEDLESLPGVGHKTASVVMAQAFNVPAFPIDTHIHRSAKRWGLSNGKSVKQTEKDLKKLFDKKDWNKLHLQIILFARKYCPARSHNKEKCPICSNILVIPGI